jgi:hypothetical protein
VVVEEVHAVFGIRKPFLVPRNGVVQGCQHPGEPALEPDGFIGLQQGAVLAEARQEAAAFLVDGTGKPKGNRVVQQAIAIGVAKCDQCGFGYHKNLMNLPDYGKGSSGRLCGFLGCGIDCLEGHGNMFDNGFGPGFLLFSEGDRGIAGNDVEADGITLDDDRQEEQVVEIQALEEGDRSIMGNGGRPEPPIGQAFCHDGGILFE